MDYKPRRTQEFLTLKAALDYLVREDGKRWSVLSLDERCNKELPSARVETRHDETLNQDRLYLKGTKIEIK